MKFLKYSIAIFLVALCFSTISASATQKYHYANITIPAFKGSWTTDVDKLKETNSYQYVQKTSCIDTVSGDERAIDGRTYKTTGSGRPDSDWIRVGTSDTTWGEQNNDAGYQYNLQLQSSKFFVTTAKYSGSWTVDK